MRLSSAEHPFSIPFSTGVAVVVMLVLGPLFGWAVAQEEWLIVVGLGLVGLVPIVIRWPVVSAFGAYAFLATAFDSIALLPGSATLTRPAGILAGGVLLVAGLMERRLTRPPGAALWFGVFMLWAAVSGTWAIDLGLYFSGLRMALSLFVLYLAVVSFKPSRKELYGICVVIVLAGVIAGAAGYVFGLDGGAQGRGRIVFGDQEGNPNSLGRTLLLPLALAVVGFVGSRGAVRRVAATACLAVIGVGIYVSMSRGALLAMTATISVLLHRTRARREVIALVLVLFALTATMPDRFYNRVTSVLTGTDSTGSGRIGLWELGLDAVLQGFGLFGAGLGNTTAVYNLYVLKNRSGFGLHNAYLSLWVELGIVGLALMLAVFASHLLAVRRARAQGSAGLVLGAAEAACCGMLASAMFADYLWVKDFWLPWILAIWAIHCERKLGEPDVSDAGLRSERVRAGVG